MVFRNLFNKSNEEKNNEITILEEIKKSSHHETSNIIVNFRTINNSNINKNLIFLSQKNEIKLQFLQNGINKLSSAMKHINERARNRIQNINRDFDYKKSKKFGKYTEDTGKIKNDYEHLNVVYQQLFVIVKQISKEEINENNYQGILNQIGGLSSSISIPIKYCDNNGLNL